MESGKQAIQHNREMAKFQEKVLGTKCKAQTTTLGVTGKWCQDGCVWEAYVMRDLIGLILCRKDV